MSEFQLSYWKDHPTEKGIVQLDHMCTYGQLRETLVDYLKSVPYTYDGEEISVYDLLDYIHTHVHYSEQNKEIPNFRWIYCWVTEGGSEGHYFHIECYSINGDVHPLLLAKTLFGTTDIALHINNEICRFILNQKI